MKAIFYLLNIALTLGVGLFLIRLFLHLVKANFRNPITEVIAKITNPIILPLRKVFPAVGKIDSASVIATILASLIMIVILLLVRGIPVAELIERPLDILWMSLKNLLSLSLQLYWILILFSILLSWIQQGNHSPITSFIHELTEPLLAPVRRLIPPIGGMDISPIPVIILISALQQQFSFAV